MNNDFADKIKKGYDNIADIWGEFERCDARHSPERDGTVEEVIHEWSKKIKNPSVKNFPYGHMKRRCVLPIGKEVTLNADTCTLFIP